jgi:aquaporin Z
LQLLICWNGNGVGVTIGVYLFGKISMSFQSAVSLGFLITRHVNYRQFLYYLSGEITRALLASLFVKYLIDSNASLGANSPNHNFPIPHNHWALKF